MMLALPDGETPGRDVFCRMLSETELRIYLIPNELNPCYTDLMCCLSLLEEYQRSSPRECRGELLNVNS